LLEHGGDIRLGRRKIARPLDTSRPLHIVLRSTRAKRDWSLLRPAFAAQIRRRIRTLARRYDLTLYGYANSGNHIHILGRARSRRGFQSFLKVFAGVTARLVTGARKGKPVGRFWDRLAYSRIVSWGRDYRAVGAYVKQNADEALGLRPHRNRGRSRTTTSRPAAPRAQAPPRSGSTAAPRA
jgi:REP element-mobilizing transposase RayT